jgi:transposase
MRGLCAGIVTQGCEKSLREPFLQEISPAWQQPRQVLMLSTLTPEQLVLADHPIRRIKVIVERALRELSPTFDARYAKNGRASIPSERLLKACLLIALYSVRSERQFCERLQYDLLLKWSLDMDIEDPAFDATTFTKNRDRLLANEVAARFFAVMLAQAKAAQLISAEHFTVDGTLLESWASLKSFQPRDSSNNRPTAAAVARGSLGARPTLPSAQTVRGPLKQLALASLTSSATYAAPVVDPVHRQTADARRSEKPPVPSQTSHRR